MEDRVLGLRGGRVRGGWLGGKGGETGLTCTFQPMAESWQYNSLELKSELGQRQRIEKS